MKKTKITNFRSNINCECRVEFTLIAVNVRSHRYTLISDYISSRISHQLKKLRLKNEKGHRRRKVVVSLTNSRD